MKATFRKNKPTQNLVIEYSYIHRRSRKPSKSSFCLLLILIDTVVVSQIQSERSKQGVGKQGDGAQDSKRED